MDFWGRKSPNSDFYWTFLCFIWTFHFYLEYFFQFGLDFRYWRIGLLLLENWTFMQVVMLMQTTTQKLDFCCLDFRIWQLDFLKFGLDFLILESA